MNTLMGVLVRALFASAWFVIYVFILLKTPEVSAMIANTLFNTALML